MQELLTMPKECMRARGSTDRKGRHGGTLLLLAWMGGFRDSDAGALLGHVGVYA